MSQEAAGEQQGILASGRDALTRTLVPVHLSDLSHNQLLHDLDVRDRLQAGSSLEPWACDVCP